ncbi:MAG: 50S ribosomal protein L19e [Thermoplasmatota archaeon]|nr:50S ribosomal protein L19e [Candidatus Thermoplasmatota archaeon]MBU1915468.1 50S ribosomal protein L19e [Candidatus Thermoplasmatota archaeon]
MDLKNQRRMASQLLKCGENRVWMDPNRAEDVSDAITRADVRTLIASGAVSSRQKKGVSRGRAEFQLAQRRKGRQRGHGSRRGRKGARKPSKERWMQTIRPIRRKLKELRDSGKIDTATYRKYYLKAKGGVFKSRPHLESHLKAEGILKE